MFEGGLHVEEVKHASFAGAKKTMKLLDGSESPRSRPKRDVIKAAKEKGITKKNVVNPPFQTLKEVMLAQLTLGLKISFINRILFVAHLSNKRCRLEIAKRGKSPFSLSNSFHSWIMTNYKKLHTLNCH